MQRKTRSCLIKRLMPFGVEVTAQVPMALDDLHDEELYELLNEYHLVLVRGMMMPDKKGLQTFAEKLGPLLKWDFGYVMEMRADVRPENYLFTHGPVPMHWDGAFHQVPHVLLFHCIEAPALAMGGETIFIDTEKLVRDASYEEREFWKQLTLTYQTEKKAHYGGQVVVPLVQRHPVTGQTILRFAEPVDPPMLNPVSVTVNELSEEAGRKLMATIAARCYLPKYSYSHTWQPDDFLMVDNFSLLHARRAFSEFTPRHLRRIQVMRG